MNVDPSYGFGSIRLSLGRFSDEGEILQAAELIARRVKKLRTE